MTQKICPYLTEDVDLECQRGFSDMTLEYADRTCRTNYRSCPYAQTSPKSTEPEYSLAFQKELDHDNPATLQERRQWRNAAEVRMKEP